MIKICITSFCVIYPFAFNIAIDLVDIHKPWVLSEKERIMKHGGTIENGRINDIIDVTRAFGDFPLVKNRIIQNII